MEAEQRKLQDAMNSIGEQLWSAHRRPIELNALKCSVKCLEDSTFSEAEAHRCMESCSIGPQQAVAIINSEFGSFQNRFQRCVYDCQDKARDKFGNSGIGDASKQVDIEQNLTSCFKSCVDEHLGVLHSMAKRLNESLSKLQ